MIVIHFISEAQQFLIKAKFLIFINMMAPTRNEGHGGGELQKFNRQSGCGYGQTRTVNSLFVFL